jgi:transcriptional regulator with XRE-family HTH domain
MGFVDSGSMKVNKTNDDASSTGTLAEDQKVLTPATGIRRPVSLTQDPHAIRDTREKVLEVAIGHEVRAFRKKLGITVADLAAATSISLGMLSKIENGITSPSLTTLQALSRALGVPLTSFFRRFEEERNAVFVKAGEGVDVERRGTRAGHQYNLLGHIGSNTAGVMVEPYLITLTEDSDVFPMFQHDGMEFLYILEGEVVYRHANNLYRMTEGDSLFFDADAPHGPDELTRLPIRYLSIISYRQGNGNGND